MRDLPLGVLGDTLVLAPVTFGDVGEAQEATERIFAGARLGQLAVFPQPRHFRGRTAPGRGGTQRWAKNEKKEKGKKKTTQKQVKGSVREGVRVCQGGKKMQKYEKAASNRDVRGRQEAAGDG